MKLSIIVVALNAGDELTATVKSILSQTFGDYEIIIKDGGSDDGSIEQLPEDPRIRLKSAPDEGIYDAMNQALAIARGTYVFFLNCGDYLYDDRVLEDVSDRLTGSNIVLYGDIYDRIAESRVSSNPNLDDFALYRNVPCHQACIYDREMLLAHPFDVSYKVRADYEQFLWCYYIARAHFIYVDRIVSSYMGGGFSETKANRRVNMTEHKEVVSKYMSDRQIRTFRRRLILSLAPLRHMLASNPVTGGLYNRLKTLIYRKGTDA